MTDAAPPPPPPPTGATAGPSVWLVVAGVATAAIVLAMLFRSFVNPVPVPTPSPSPSPMPTVKASPTPSPSPSPPASPTPSPSPSPSASPTSGPSASPSTAPSASPTAGPSATNGPTSAPSSTPSAPPSQTTSCSQPNTGVTVVYPVAWYTVDEPPQYACAFFDSSPIVIPSDQTFPDAPVGVLADETPYQQALDGLTDTTKWTVLSQADATVSGLPATVAEVSWIGKAPYTVGTMRYFYLVDRGAQGSMLFVTQGTAGSAYDTDKQVVDLMASKSTIAAAR